MNFVTANAAALLRLIGWVNLSLLLLLTPLYPGEWIARTAPTLFSDAGIFVIALWGLVYLAVSEDPPRYARLLSVLALEKAFYAMTGLAWLQQNTAQLPTLFAADPVAGLFYATYGLWDGACAVVLVLLWRHYAIAARTPVGGNKEAP
jgi:hypothetical protein